MGTGLLSTERTANVPADRATRSDLVLPVSSARSERAAPEDARVGGCKTQIRVRDLTPDFSTTGRLVKSDFQGEIGHEEVEIH